MTLPKFDYLMKDAGKIYGVKLAIVVYQDSRMTETSPTQRFIVLPHDPVQKQNVPFSTSCGWFLHSKQKGGRDCSTQQGVGMEYLGENPDCGHNCQLTDTNYNAFLFF